MSARLVNVSPGDVLVPGGHPSYFRAVFEDAPWNPLSFERGMENVMERIPDTGLVLATHSNPYVPGDAVAVVDLRVVNGAENETVAELARTLEELTGSTKLVSLERIDGKRANARERGAVDDEAEQERRDESLGGQIAKTLRELRLLIIVGAIALLVWYAVKFRALRRLRRMFK